MAVIELVGFMTRVPPAGSRVVYRRYTKSGTEAWRFARIPPTVSADGLPVVFRAHQHDPQPPKRLPLIDILESYVLAAEREIFLRENPECKSTPLPSSTTSPLDREPPTRAEPAPPGPGLPTRSSRRTSSAQSVATTTAGQLKLDL